MRVLDLFAGLEGWSGPFRAAGHDVLSLDNDPRFEVDITADILEWDPDSLPWKPDIILASPPCEKFSTLAFQHGYFTMSGDKKRGTNRYEPTGEAGELAIRLVRRTVDIISYLQPEFFVIENPRALLRQLRIIPWERRTVTYCQFGEWYMKPTDLWGGFPPSLVLPPPCKNGAPCHIAAPRGSRTGIQGGAVLTLTQEEKDALTYDQRRNLAGGRLAAHKTLHREKFGTSDGKKLAALRAKIPERLSTMVMEAAARDLGKPSIPMGQLTL